MVGPCLSASIAASDSERTVSPLCELIKILQCMGLKSLSALPPANQCVRFADCSTGLADTLGVTAWGWDTGGEFGVVRLFTGKTVRPGRVRHEIRSGRGRGGWPIGRAGEIATSVGWFGGQLPRTTSGTMQGYSKLPVSYDRTCWVVDLRSPCYS